MLHNATNDFFLDIYDYEHYNDADIEGEENKETSNSLQKPNKITDPKKVDDEDYDSGSGKEGKSKLN